MRPPTRIKSGSIQKNAEVGLGFEDGFHDDRRAFRQAGHTGDHSSVTVFFAEELGKQVGGSVGHGTASQMTWMLLPSPIQPMASATVNGSLRFRQQLPHRVQAK